MSGTGKDANGKPKAPAKSPGKESLRPPLPKRFYKKAGVAARGHGFAILLDGRSIKTPGKRELNVPSSPLAEAITVEWAIQGERIDPATMPLTRMCNTAIDAVAGHAAAVAADIAAFAGSDLLCYRAAGPEGLVERQHARWDPILDWAKNELGAGLVVGEGVMPVAQLQDAIERIAAALGGLDEFRLAALHVLTTLSGSALLALAHLRGRLTLDEAWSAAHIDEDWQIEHWGADSEAAARRRMRRIEFEAASRLLALVSA